MADAGVFETEAVMHDELCPLDECQCELIARVRISESRKFADSVVQFLGDNGVKLFEEVMEALK